MLSDRLLCDLLVWSNRVSPHQLPVGTMALHMQAPFSVTINEPNTVGCFYWLLNHMTRGRPCSWWYCQSCNWGTTDVLAKYVLELCPWSPDIKPKRHQLYLLTCSMSMPVFFMGLLSTYNTISKAQRREAHRGWPRSLRVSRKFEMLKFEQSLCESPTEECTALLSVILALLALQHYNCRDSVPQHYSVFGHQNCMKTLL